MRQSPLRLRVTLGQEPELRCAHCGFWYAIDTENWELNDWDRCRACKRMAAKLNAALRGRDAEYRVAKADKSRRYRAWLKVNCPQYLPAYERERKAQRRQYARERRARIRDEA